MNTGASESDAGDAASVRAVTEAEVADDEASGAALCSWRMEVKAARVEAPK